MEASSLPDFDVIVVGAGHAGLEALAAAARLGVRACAFTSDPAKAGTLSCNPAFGGVAKGQIVHEIDALGGLMGLAADRAAIQFRTLNTKKGPAVRSLRAQVERAAYPGIVQALLRETPGADLRAGTVVEILATEEGVAGEVDPVVDGRAHVRGVRLADGSVVTARAVVVTTGTFLNGLIHAGAARLGGGRRGEAATHGVSESLARLGHRIGRLKTGTPPRIDARSLDARDFPHERGDRPARGFSIETPTPRQIQVDCLVAHTNAHTHDIVRREIEHSALGSGRLSGTGPRYCPSLEDKVRKFPDRDTHLLFLEPEGRNTPELYVSGLSNSFRPDVQLSILRSIRGLENVVMIRPGYAIEYDFADPRDLRATYESRRVAGLFLAGQINGTTGYEEAGGQGILAGINAALRSQGREDFPIGRSEAYIGILADDLTRRGVDEPYRMFTSRAEFRLHLREDNAWERLSGRAMNLGLISSRRARLIGDRFERLVLGRLALDRATLDDRDGSLARARAENLPAVHNGLSAATLLRRPEVTLDTLARLFGETLDLRDLEPRERHALDVSIRYEGFLTREAAAAERAREHERMGIPDALDFEAIPNLSIEAKQKLTVRRPRTVHEASGLPGIRPSDLVTLVAHLTRRAAAAVEA